MACINICKHVTDHVKDPVVHVRVRWIKETHSMHRRLGSATLSQLAFPRGKQPEYPMRENPFGTIEL